MSKSPLPRKCRLVWRCLLASAFLIGMSATSATACSTFDLPRPTVSLSYDSSSIRITANFGNSRPDKHCWKVEILPKNARNGWQTVEEDCNETTSYYVSDQQFIYWSDTDIAPGGTGWMNVKVRSLRKNCPAYWSPWGHSGAHQYTRPSGN